MQVDEPSASATAPQADSSSATKMDVDTDAKPEEDNGDDDDNDDDDGNESDDSMPSEVNPMSKPPTPINTLDPSPPPDGKTGDAGGDDDDDEDEVMDEYEKEVLEDAGPSAGASSSSASSSSSSAVKKDVEDQVRRNIARQESEHVAQNQRMHAKRLKEVRDQQNAELAQDEDRNAMKRLLFLERQAEVFAQFMSTEDSSSSSSSASAKGKGKKKSGRTRKSEEEEDKEMLEAELRGTRLTRLTVQPGCIKGGTMRAYQIEGLNWLVNLYEQGINGILADEMGLGKTLQSISLLGYLMFDRGISGPHIVIVPKSVLGNWQREFRKWCPDMRIIKVHGSKDERKNQLENDMRPGEFDVCVTTYEIVIKERTAFQKLNWRYLVMDEAHRLKNEETRLAQVVRELNVQFRLLITGTPLQNNLRELWALLNFLLPEVFSDASVFEEYFKLDELSQEGVVARLHNILRPFMIRRLKSDVEKSLPPKREIKLYTGMTEMQEWWYKSTLNKDVMALNQLGGPERTRLLNILMQLRKVCNHPYLFQGAEPGPPYIDGPHLWENSGKMVLLDKLLPKLKAQGDRVLIFSQMTRLLDILEDYMRLKGYQYCRIDGNTKGDERDLFMDQFNAPGSEKFVFLLSTRAGGLGINLATANIVILYDSDWNPQMDLQAQDRAHRIGQTKEVTVFRFVTEGTVEEKIVERAEKKLYLDAVVVQQGRLQQTNKALSKTELMTMVKFGAEAIFKSNGARVTDEDIDIILERSTKKTEEQMEKFKTDVQHNLANFRLEQEDTRKPSYMLEGDESSLLLSDDTGGHAFNFMPVAQRQRRPTSYNVNDAFRKMDDEAKAKTKIREPKLPKGMTMLDFQFFDVAQVRTFEEKENEFIRQRRVQQELIRAAKARERRSKTPTGDAGGDGDGADGEGGAGDGDAGSSNEQLESAQLEQEMQTMQLSDEDKAAKQRLIDEGFGSWNRQHYRQYIAACERFGRDDASNIVKVMMEQTGKTEDDIRRYHKVFWKRYQELSDWQRLIDRVEKGEQKIKRRQQITELLDRKIASTPNAFQTLKIQYGSTRGKTYTEDEDRFLICMTQKLGYGVRCCCELECVRGCLSVASS